MVDFIKFHVKNANFIRDILDFKVQVSEKTGDILPFSTAEYKGLKFRITVAGTLEVKGSIHKYYNEGKHNYNDFTFEMLTNALNKFSNEFKIKLDQCTLVNIEFGLNFTPKTKTKSILDNLIIYNNQPFDSRFQGSLMEVILSEYKLKLYAKGKQYRLEEDIMRFEIHFRKSRKFHPLNIFNLEDFKKRHWIIPVQEILLKEWDKILLYDNEILTPNTERNHNWQIPHKWQQLHKVRRCREKERFKKIYHIGLHAECRKLISEKWTKLSTPTHCDMVTSKKQLVNDCNHITHIIQCDIVTHKRGTQIRAY